MKRQSGFTLIELVVVIVILGILAATAAPKFMNLQGDARISALNGLKGAVKSAVSMTYSKAILKGIEKKETGTVCSTSEGTSGCSGDEIKLVYGRPDATADGLLKALDLDATEWSNKVDDEGTMLIYSASSTVEDTNQIDDADKGCNLSYKAATQTEAPKITVNTGGC